MLALAGPQPVLAIPGSIGYQGLLNGAGGVPASGSFGFVFSLYSASSGGTALWTENQTVSVSNGVFNVQLGAVSPFPDGLFVNNALYLGIKVGADSEMTPRQQVTSSAFSQRAELLTAPVAPTGSIVAWNKSMPGTPPLPAGWVECNGQVLSDPLSPYQGQTIPNLNGASGQSRFLRGSTTSGAIGGSDTHMHTLAESIFAGNGVARHDMGAVSSVSHLPSYYSVVWIMRVR